MFTIHAAWQDVLLTWNPVTFYALTALVQSGVVYGVYRLLSADPQHNTYPTALIAALLGNGVAYGLRDLELIFAFIGTVFIYFGILAAFSAGDMVRSLIVAGAVVATYVGLAHGLIPRTAFEARAVGGIPEVAMQGGFEKSPVEETPSDFEVDAPDP